MLTNEFLNNVCEKIRYKPIRNEIANELKNHIEEQKENYIQEGMKETEAEEKAVEQMGNAKELGKDLNKIHKPKLDWKLLLLILILISYGVLVSFIRVKSGARGITMEGYIKSLGLGLILSTVVYFMDYRKMSKYSIIFYILATLCFILGYRNRSFFGRAYLNIFSTRIQCSVLAMPLYIIAFVGLIYNINERSKIKITMYNKKHININVAYIIIALSIISLYLFVTMGHMPEGVILGLTYMTMATIKLSMLKRKAIKYIAILWGVPLLVILSFLIITINNDAYRLIKIEILFHPEIDSQGEGWEAFTRNQVIESAKMFGEVEGIHKDIIMHFREGTAWAFISILAEYGWVPAMTMVLAVILLSIKLIINARNIKEEYGKWLIIGIATMFILQSIFNVAMNLGFGIISNFTIPLVSYGIPSLIINMMSLALVLSVYRRKDINIYDKDTYKEICRYIEL